MHLFSLRSRLICLSFVHLTFSLFLAFTQLKCAAGQTLMGDISVHINGVLFVIEGHSAVDSGQTSVFLFNNLFIK